MGTWGTLRQTNLQLTDQLNFTSWDSQKAFPCSVPCLVCWGKRFVSLFQFIQIGDMLSRLPIKACESKDT